MVSVVVVVQYEVTCAITEAHALQVFLVHAAAILIIVSVRRKVREW